MCQSSCCAALPAHILWGSFMSVRVLKTFYYCTSSEFQLYLCVHNLGHTASVSLFPFSVMCKGSFVEWDAGEQCV